MQQQKIIASVVKILKRRYQSDASGHDFLHLERVWKMAQRLAQGENVNEFVLEMAALLHDVDDYKFKKDGEDELSETKKILDSLNVERSDQDHILSIVKNVSYKGAGVATNQETLEGKIVQDADRLDAMGAIGIARVFAYGGSAGHPYYDPAIKPQRITSFTQYKSHKKTTINHFYEKLLLLKDRMNMPQAKEIAKRRHKFLKHYLQEFFDEMKMER